MEAAFFAIVVIIAIVRGIYRFFRWATVSLKRMSALGATYAPPQPMPPAQAAPFSAYERGRPAPMPRPAARNTVPPPAVSRDATTGDFPEQERRLMAAESSSVYARIPDEATTSPPSNPQALFGDTSNLVRALILQEALGPPLCKRRPPAD